MSDASSLMNSIPQGVMDAIYRDYPAYRAIVTIIQGLESLEDIHLEARLTGPEDSDEQRAEISFCIEHAESRTRVFKIIYRDGIFFTFDTRFDLDRFIELAALDHAPTGRALWPHGDPYPLHMERTLFVEGHSFEYPLAAEALASVMTETPMRRLLARDDDSDLQRLLRRYASRLEEWEANIVLADIARCINENNFDFAFDSLSDFNPWHEEDPDDTPGMALCILDEMIREQGRVYPQTRDRLVRLRDEFEKLGERAKYDIAETEDLLRKLERLGKA